MPLPSTGSYPISNKDVLSFIFDDPTYDIDHPILIDARDPSSYLSHRSIQVLVRKLIAGLHAAGLQDGDKVCIHSFNSIWYPALVLGVIGAGGCTVSTNPGYTKLELEHAIKVAKVKYVLAEADILENILPALASNHIDANSKLWIVDGETEQNTPKQLKSWKTLLTHGVKEWPRFDDEGKSKDKVVQLYYTSGTTGLPKCAVVTHRNLVAQHQLSSEAIPRPYPWRVVLAMPFFHIGVGPIACVSTIKEGRTVYVMHRFELQPFLSYQAKYKCNELFVAPPMVTAIVASGLSDPQSENYQPQCSLRSLRRGAVGAAPCSLDMQKRMSALFGDGAALVSLWGMTEVSGGGTIIPDTMNHLIEAKHDDAFGHVGKPMMGLSMKLINEKGEDVSESGRGELCVKGPTVVKGYFENEKATKESWDADGYFMTGDVVQVRKSDGVLQIIDRVKELIKVRGFQVAPPELEAALLEHPSIDDAAVIGVKLNNNEEAPKAYIVCRQSAQLTESDVHKYMAKRLSRYKQLTGGVKFVDLIPKSPSGKILKRTLRELEAREAAGQSKL